MKKKGTPKKLAITLAASVGLVVAIVGYESYAVSSKVNLQKVYFTKVDIPPRTKITKDMLQVREVSNNSIPPNAIKNTNDIVGKYTVNGFGLAENSYVFKDKVVSKDELPDAAILNLKPSEVAFPLLVDIETSSGNSIIPESHVDLYFKGTVKDKDEKGEVVEKPIFGRIAKHVRVTAVKDSNAANVFDPATINVEGSYQDSLKEEAKNRPMAKIYTFAVNEEENTLLNQGTLIGKIIPVASGTAYKTNVEKTADEQIVKWIQKQSYKVK